MKNFFFFKTSFRINLGATIMLSFLLSFLLSNLPFAFGETAAQTQFKPANFPTASVSSGLSFSYIRVTKLLNPSPLISFIDPNLIYRVMGGNVYSIEKIQVKSRDELLKQMGAASEKDLSDGQKGLLQTFDLENDKDVKELRKLVNGNIEVQLFDTTFVQGVSKETLLIDFWPNAPTGAIAVSSIFTDAYGITKESKESKRTLLHEMSHLTFYRAYSSYYGPDGGHTLIERLNPETAFDEGFANFNEKMVTYDCVERIKIEKPTSTPGSPDYESFSVLDPKIKATDLLSVEGIVYKVLFLMSKKIPDGEKKIREFITNDPFLRSKGNIISFIQKFTKQYPEYTNLAIKVLDKETSFRFTNKELTNMFGSSVKNYVKNRKDKHFPPIVESASVGSPKVLLTDSSVTTGTVISTDTGYEVESTSSTQTTSSVTISIETSTPTSIPVDGKSQEGFNDQF
ncbi:MAG: hypothetical protein HQM10_21665 [Candidatus Riflebacteria bacterium]|nr:hypothetical protein [Candidatus Riflebacteria bacterium]